MVQIATWPTNLANRTMCVRLGGWVPSDTNKAAICGSLHCEAAGSDFVPGCGDKMLSQRRSRDLAATTQPLVSRKKFLVLKIFPAVCVTGPMCKTRGP